MTIDVADEVIAKFVRRTNDWTTRVLKGSLDPENIARAVQAVVDRKPWFSLVGEASLVCYDRLLVEADGIHEDFVFQDQKFHLAVSVEERAPLCTQAFKKKVRIDKNVKPSTLGKYELTDRLHHQEIYKKLPEPLFFENLEEAQIVVARLLLKQWRGEKGVLATDGTFNYFLIKTDLAYAPRAISVSRSPSGGQWAGGWSVRVVTYVSLNGRSQQGTLFFTK